MATKKKKSHVQMNEKKLLKFEYDIFKKVVDDNFV